MRQNQKGKMELHRISISTKIRDKGNLYGTYKKKIGKKHFYDEYDKKINDNPTLEVWERRHLSPSHVRFGNSKEDKSAILFFSSLLKEFNIPVTPII